VAAGSSGGKLQLEADRVKNAKFYKYLGVMTKENGSSTEEIKIE
jgi:hypothetical protein